MAENINLQAGESVGEETSGDILDPRNPIYKRADRFVLHIGNVFAWVYPILIVAIVSQVFLRGAGHNQAWLDDLQWWLYGFAGLMGFGYAVTTNSHVRVDIFYDRFSPEKKAKLEVFGLAWLLLPFTIVMADLLFHYAVASWSANEGSDSPNGLHGLYWLKTTLPILFGVAAIGAWSAYNRNLAKFTEPTWFKKLAYALPTTWFFAERVVFYVMWWFYRITQPDLNIRRIQKQDIFDYTPLLGLALVALLLVVTFAMARGSKSSSTDSSSGA